MARRKADYTGLVLQGKERSWPRIIVEHNVAIAATVRRTARKHNTPARNQLLGFWKLVKEPTKDLYRHSDL